MSWVSASILSLLFFGLWGFFTKLAVNIIDPRSAFLYQTCGGVLISLILVSFFNYRPHFELKGFIFSLLIGVTSAVGSVFYFYASSKGKITTVITLTALYPLITILMAYFLLHETLNVKQCLGVIFALIAIVLMSY